MLLSKLEARNRSQLLGSGRTSRLISLVASSRITCILSGGGCAGYVGCVASKSFTQCGCGCGTGNGVWEPGSWVLSAGVSGKSLKGFRS